MANPEPTAAGAEVLRLARRQDRLGSQPVVDEIDDHARERPHQVDSQYLANVELHPPAEVEALINVKHPI